MAKTTRDKIEAHLARLKQRIGYHYFSDTTVYLDERIGALVDFVDTLRQKRTYWRQHFDELAKEVASSIRKAREYDRAMDAFLKLDKSETMTQALQQTDPLLTLVRYCVEHTNRCHANDDATERRVRAECEQRVALVLAHKPLSLADVSAEALLAEINRRMKNAR